MPLSPPPLALFCEWLIDGASNDGETGFLSKL